MAKKVKTPEEYQAAIDKKVAKRTLFFGTFRKALAFFLSVAFTFAMVQIAFTAKSGGTVTTGGNAAGGEQSAETTTEPDLIGEDKEKPDDGKKPTGADAKEEDVSKADAVKLLNEATAAAAKAGYDWSRKCYYTDDGAIQVKTNGGKDATDVLNKAIHTADEKASIDSVVGGFLDITGKDAPLAAKKPKGSAAAPEGMKDKFLLKGMSLTEADVARFDQDNENRNIYKFQLNACSNPQKDGGNALSRATNDFVTQEEVVKRIGEELPETVIGIESSDIQFKSIVIVAEIKDGKLISLTINYLMDVTSLNLKVLRITNVVGSGKGQVEETYKNFAY